MQRRRAARLADVDDARDFRWAGTFWVMMVIDDVSAVAFSDVLRGDGNSFLKDLRRDEWVRGGEQKVIMIGGGTLVFLGVVGVVYTWESVGTRWMWSAHIGVALSWRHSLDLRRDKWVGEGGS